MNSEQALRDVLAEHRPVGAPGGLRHRVRSLADRPARRAGWRERSRLAAQVSVGALGLAFVLAVLVGVGWGLMPPRIGLEPPAPPAQPAFNPDAEGVGIVAGAADMLGTVPWILTAIAVVVLTMVALRARPWVRVAAPILAIAVVAGAQSFVSLRPVSFGYGWGPLDGLQVVRTNSFGNSPEPVYVTAPPDGQIGVAFTIKNNGPLPVHVLGVVDYFSGDDLDWVGAPVWTAVGMYPQPHGEFLGIEAAQPFQPIDLAPGEYLNLYLIGRAGICALGQEIDPLSVADEFTRVSRPMEMAYSMLGMTAVQELDLPFVVVEPQDPDCTAYED